VKKSHFLKNTLLFSLATLISRILGYIRDAVIAYIFGANALTDAFFVAWRIPNTLRQLVAEGSFNAAFIPIYTDLSKKDPDYAREYASSLFSYYTLTLSFITVIVVLFSKFFVYIVAPGLIDKGTINEASKLLKIVFPYIILVGWVSFFMALLNTRDRFFIPAVSPALLNLSFIFSALVLSQYLGIYALAIGALIGGVMQVLLQIPLLVKESLIPHFSLRFVPEIKETLKRLVPAFASFGVSQFAFVVDTVIASFLVGGAISYLYYANRIFQLPIGLFAVGLGNALLVSLSRHFSDRNMEGFSLDLNRGLRFAIFISLPATAGMVVLGREILGVLLERGAFSHQDTLMTYTALVGYSLGLLGYAVSRPFKSAFFAMGDTKTPLYSTVTGLIVSIFSAVITGFLLGWGVFGLALASSLGGFAGLFYLILVGDFKLDKKGVLSTFLKTGLATAIMVMVIQLLKLFTDNPFILVFTGIPAGIAVFFGSSYLLKENSLIFLLDSLKKRATPP